MDNKMQLVKRILVIALFSTVVVACGPKDEVADDSSSASTETGNQSVDDKDQGSAAVTADTSTDSVPKPEAGLDEYVQIIGVLMRYADLSTDEIDVSPTHFKVLGDWAYLECTLSAKYVEAEEAGLCGLLNRVDGEWTVIDLEIGTSFEEPFIKDSWPDEVPEAILEGSWQRTKR